MLIKIAVLASILAPSLVLFGAVTTLAHPSTMGEYPIVKSEITTSIKAERINRQKILTAFFSKNNSPLVKNVNKFVEIADKYNIDYRLMPAISCTESSCGKFLIERSHNPFGWGIYGNTVTSFKSYDDAIEKVAQGLSKGYISKGYDTPEEIGPIYTPPSYTHWMRATRFFMNQIDEIAVSKL